jgi:hypothetical protein
LAAHGNKARHNVYCGVGLYDPAKITNGSRGDAAAVAGLVGLWADVDIQGPNHKGTSYPPTETAARELLAATGMPPTLIVQSGGGLQPWWLFNEPWIFESEEEHAEAAAIARGWIRNLQEHAKARDWQLDPTGDLARVLRVAGTLNHKSTPPRPITAEGGGPRYEPSDFRSFMEAIRLPGDPAPAPGVFNRENLSRQTLQFLALGASEGERNGRLYRAACDLAGNGADYPTACALLEQAAGRSGLEAEEIRQTINSAYGSPREPARKEEEAHEIGTAWQATESSDASPAGGTPPDTGGGRTDKPQKAPAPGRAVSGTGGTRPLVGNISDGKREIDGEIKPVHYLIPPELIASAVYEATGGWPRSVCGQLFVYDEPKDGRMPEPFHVRFLGNADKLFAFLHEHCLLRWDTKPAINPPDGRTANPITKTECFQYIASHPHRHYLSVELQPHEPEMADAWYAPVELPDVLADFATPQAFEESPLGKLIKSLNPDTEYDRWLMLAAMLTPGWGGPPGNRPAFVFASDHGRGVGKTTTAEVISAIWGGHIQIKPNEDRERITQRLLAESSLPLRIVLIDNLKSTLSDGDIESLITVGVIDGHKLYSGQSRRINTLAWFITANTPQLSKDLADRSVVIKLGRQAHINAFRGWAVDFIRIHRKRIIAQLLHFLRLPAKSQIPNEFRDRWNQWQDAVLTRFKNGHELARIIMERRGPVDADLEQATDIANCIIRHIGDNFPDYKSRIISFTRKQLATWLEEDGLVDEHMRPRAITTMVKNNLASGPLSCLKQTPVKDGGAFDRVWVWYGELADPEQSRDKMPEAIV